MHGTQEQKSLDDVLSLVLDSDSEVGNLCFLCAHREIWSGVMNSPLGHCLFPSGRSFAVNVSSIGVFSGSNPTRMTRAVAELSVQTWLGAPAADHLSALVPVDMPCRFLLRF